MTIEGKEDLIVMISVYVAKQLGVQVDNKFGGRSYEFSYYNDLEPVFDNIGIELDHNDDNGRKLMDRIQKLVKEKLCKKGEAYRKRRMAAGEKSSAYLSGRAVKVCKGQISGRKKRKNKRKRRKI